MSFKLGNATSSNIIETDGFLRLLVWGIPGVGKTVLAYSAPKPIFGIQFDNQGSASVRREDGIEILDLSGEAGSITNKFKVPMEENTEIKAMAQYIIGNKFSTIVFDSCTTFGEKAFDYSIRMGPTLSKDKGGNVSYEEPGYVGFGVKNMLVNQAIKNLLKLAKYCNTHLVIVAHEALPQKDKKGVPVLSTINIGSSLAFQIPIDLSETWHMTDSSGRRILQLRDKGLHKPMKTRMFTTVKHDQFVWNYKQETGEGDTLEVIYNRWKANNFQKIEPST